LKINDSTSGDSAFLAASFNFMRELSPEERLFKSASFPTRVGAKAACPKPAQGGFDRRQAEI
jgi:hypothetical protein